MKNFHVNSGLVRPVSETKFEIVSLRSIPSHRGETPSPFTEYGIKRGGEGGRMGAPQAVCSAIEYALRRFGVKIDALPVTPRRLRTLIREAQARAA